MVDSSLLPEGEILTIKQTARHSTISTIHRWLNGGIIAGERLAPSAPWRIRLTNDLPLPSGCGSDTSSSYLCQPAANEMVQPRSVPHRRVMLGWGECRTEQGHVYPDLVDCRR
jgi:hypothetical protein